MYTRQDITGFAVSAVVHTLILMMPLSLSGVRMTFTPAGPVKVRISSPVSRPSHPLPQERVQVPEKKVLPGQERKRKLLPEEAVQEKKEKKVQERSLPGEVLPPVKVTGQVSREASSDRPEMAEPLEMPETEKENTPLEDSSQSEDPVTSEDASTFKDAPLPRVTGPYRGEFGGPSGPKFLRQVLPEYPPLARRHGKEGVVLLKLFIDRNGILKNAEVVESAGFGFDEAALRAVRKSEYLPAMVGGDAVESEALLRVRFRLR
jgi:protein TonB